MRVAMDTDVLMRAIHRHWTGHVETAVRAAARVSTGTSAMSAVNDASGVAIHARQRSTSNGLAQAGRNVQDAISVARVGQGGLSEMTAMLQRMRTLAVQSANGTYADGQRAFMQAAVVMTLDEMDKLVERTRAAGKSMLSGGTLTVQVGSEASQGVQFTLADARRANLGLEDGANGPGINIATQEGARSALQVLDEALQELFEEQARTAAMESRMAAAARALAVQEANQEAALSRAHDVDIAKEASTLAHATMLQETSAAMMQHVVQVQYSILDLLNSLEPVEPPVEAAGGDGAAAPVSQPVAAAEPVQTMPAMPMAFEVAAASANIDLRASVSPPRSTGRSEPTVGSSMTTPGAGVSAASAAHASTASSAPTSRSGAAAGEPGAAGVASAPGQSVAAKASAGNTAGTAAAAKAAAAEQTPPTSSTKAASTD